MSPVCGVRAEQEKAHRISAHHGGRAGESRASGHPEVGVRVPVAGRAGGPARSSGEGPVMRLERRGRVVRDPFVRSTGVIREESGERVESTGQVV